MYIIEIKPSGKVKVHPASNSNKPSVSQLKAIVGEHIAGHPISFHQCVMVVASMSIDDNAPICTLAEKLMPDRTHRIKGSVVLAKEEGQSIVGIEESEISIILADLAEIDLLEISNDIKKGQCYE